MNEGNSEIPALPIDLIGEFHKGTYSLEEAETLLHSFQEAWRNRRIPHWSDAVGLSSREATAYLHGACIEDLVRLRFEGWPEVCFVCGRPVDYENSAWRFFPGEELDKEGVFVMHLDHVPMAPDDEEG